jgi:hypothetical protein
VATRIKSAITRFSSTRKLTLFTFAGVFGISGLLFLFVTRASTPNVGVEAENATLSGQVAVFEDQTASGGRAIKFGTETPVTFKLFSPAWRGLGAFDAVRTQKSVLSKFTEVFGQDDDFDPVTVKSDGAKAYKYSLGPYVTPEYVPCDYFPPDNPQATCGKKSAVNRETEGYLDPATIPKGPYYDATGNLLGNFAVYAADFRNNILIKPDHTKWLKFLEYLTKQQMHYKNGSTFPWDGLLSDSMGINPAKATCQTAADNTNSGYLVTCPYLVESSKTTYTVAQWLNASRETLKKKRDVLRTSIGADRKMIMNGLGEGARYETYDMMNNLLKDADGPVVDGAMAESIFRNADSKVSQFPAYGEWLKDIEMIEDVERNKITGYWWSKCWDQTKLPKTCLDEGKPELVKQWRRFAIGSFLVAAGSRSYFNWDEDYTDQYNNQQAAEYYDEYGQAIALGAAIGSRQPVPGLTNIWSRAFSKGFVYVNPTTTNVSITLPPGSYKKYDSTQAAVSGIINLPANSSELFIQQI